MSVWATPSDGPTLSTVQKIGLAGEIMVTYPRVRWLLWRRDLPSAVRALRADPTDVSCTATPSTRSYWNGRRLGRAVSRTLRLLPADSRCLSQSLVLLALLARRGIRSRLVIGARQGPEFGAHAWVELGGAPLLNPGAEYERLVEI